MVSTPLPSPAAPLLAASPTHAGTRRTPGSQFLWPDLPLSLLCAVAFALWQSIGTGRFSFRYLAVAAALSVTALLAGRLIERALRFQRSWDFPLRFLAGYLLLNTALYVLVWVTPFGLPANFSILAALVLAGTVFTLRHPPAPSPRATPTPWVPPTLCLLLSLLAASLWSQDSITPVVRRDDTVILKPWGDSPFHVSQVAIFAASHGARTIQDQRMAGAPEHFTYHYASYAFPALLTAAGKAPAYFTTCCFWVPVGLLLSGLAAYALVRWWWGPWPAVAGAALLLLAPDAAYQGFDNYFLSYHWLVQVTAGSFYGMAVAAVAWVVMFEACRARRFGLMLLSFVTLAVGLVFKAHLVLPSALPLYAFPAIAMAGVPRRWRAAWLAGAVLTFVLTVYLSQRSPQVPVLRPDFSAVKDYLAIVVRQFEHVGPVRQAFARFTPASALSHDLAWGGAMLFVCTFGLAGLAYPFLAVGLSRAVPRSVLLFPLIFVAVYLFMSLALAYDDRKIGHPEELLHRPFPWAYFVLYAWVGGALYRAAWGDAPPARGPARLALSLLLLASLVVPAYFGHGVITGPSGSWGAPANNRRYDVGLVDCATFIRQQSRGRRPIMQDSTGDPVLIVSALSEAQAYASSCNADIRPPVGLPERLEDVTRLPDLTGGDAVRTYAADRGIVWYLLHPQTKTAWPATLLSRPAFESHGYRVYRFPASAPSQSN